MSTHNPLNDFNSYSYHHFLIIANSTESADSIANSPEEFFQYIRSGTDAPGLSVLVNPMSSNKLIIQDISWSTIMNGDSGTSVTSTAGNAFAEGKMTIVEPNGVRFFNKIYDTYRNFNLSGGGTTAVWVLKTIFVGYKDVPANGQPEYIANLKPMSIFPTQFSAQYTEAGGVYEIEFVAANNGAGSSRISNSTAVSTGGGVNLGASGSGTDVVTLDAAMNNLQTRIADIYNTNYEKVAKDQANAKDSKIAKSIPEKIEYAIILSEMLKDSSFVLKVPPQDSVGGNGNVPSFAIQPGDRLDQTINRILMMCPKLTDLASKGDANGDTWLPVIHTTTDSLDPAQHNGVRVRNNFWVIMRKIVKQYDPATGAEKTEEVKTAQGTTTVVADGTNGSSNTSPEATAVKQGAIDASNYLEFDYTYTGKNVDVLTYEMRMNMATGLFQGIISPSATASTGQYAATENVNVVANVNSMGNGLPGPVVNPKVANSPEALHSSNPQSVSTFQDIYKRWVNVETVHVQMKIRGNPSLLDSLVLTTSDLQRAVEGAGGPNGLAGNWLNGPIVVKINVRMPVDDEPGVYESFWYDGFYRVLTVQTNFSGGEFSQELELLAISDGSYNQVDNSQAPRPKASSASTEDFAAFAASAEPTGDRKPIGQLKLSLTGAAWIKKFESFSATKYPDNGKYAIGYGHNFTDAESASGIIYLDSGNVNVNGSITREQADELFYRDVKRLAENDIHRKVSVNMYQHEYDILCSMCYNLGPGVILGPDSTLLKLLNRQQYTLVPEQIKQWNKWRRNGVLVPNSGLTERRNKEAQLWATT